MLSEQGQNFSAIQELANAYLKQWPAMMPGQVAPPTSVLVFTLREVASLLQQLGNAPPQYRYISLQVYLTVADSHRDLTLYQMVRFKERIQCSRRSEFTGPRESTNILLY